MKPSLKILSVSLLALSLTSCSFSFDFGGSDNTGTSASPTETVSESKVTVTLDYDELTLIQGENTDFSAVCSDGTPVQYVSSREDVVYVNDKGHLFALKEGTSVLTAYTSKAQASCVITVTRNTTHVISFLEDEFVMDVNKTIHPVDTSSCNVRLNYFSMDEEVASVTDDGTITSVGEGSTSIVAYIEGDIRLISVTVTEEESDRSEKGKLIWNDEFDGTALDTSKWGYQIGVKDSYHGIESYNYYWGNEEAQYYTQDAVSVSDGYLKITATREAMDYDRTYSSGRILTRDLATFTYGYMEARISLPDVDGMWPAFWMLPQPMNTSTTQNEYGGWPSNGELDIMEAKGRTPMYACTTVHFGTDWQNHVYKTNNYHLSSSIRDFHTYAVDWRSDHMTWYIDGEPTFTVLSSEWYTGASDAESAPYDKPFYLILNLAVGGTFDNYTEPDASFTSDSMIVDYVRVYE